MLESVGPVDPLAENLEDKQYDVVDSDGVLVEQAVDKPVITMMPKLTKGQLGKIRRVHVTINHPRVTGCLHRLDLTRHPKHRGCHSCWFAWFQNNGPTVATADELYKAGNKKLIEELNGTIFYKHFLMFMATIEGLKEKDVNLQKQEGAEK
jgi:hypothetical protein